MKIKIFTKKRIIIFLLLVILVVAFTFALNYFPKLYLNSKRPEIDEINSLRLDLNMGNLNTDNLSNLDPGEIVSRYSSLIEINNALSKKDQYISQKSNIIKWFDTLITNYNQVIGKYSQLDLSFLPNNLDSIDFSTKKDPTKYLNDLKSKFRTAIVNYNLTSPTNMLRWEIDPVQEVNYLSFDEKIGMLFVFTFSGSGITDDERNFIQNNHIGGLTYFGENVEGESQVKNLSHTIQLLNAKYPIFIAVDQEGADVMRFWWDDTRGARELASLSSEDQCTVWRNRSNLLAQDGVNWNLGIIADTTSDYNSFIYPRTFSGDFNESANDVATAVNCTEGVLSTIKHWPGHGATQVDTHSQPAKLFIDNEDGWKVRDLIPFKAGIESGADSIMQGHLIMSWLDSNPASLSKASVDYIRNNLGFKGLIVTDDLNMLTNAGYSIEDVATQALLAGNDILFVVDNDLDTQQRLIDTAKNLVNNNQIPLSDLDNRVVRILEKKSKIIPRDNYFVGSILVY